MLREFRSFLLRGNVVDLAVAVVVGAAFTAVVFFLVLKPVIALMAHLRTEPDVERPTRDCPECLSAIPMAATRCAFCTAGVPRLDG